MTVLTGLAELYSGGYDLSGDVGVISRIAGGPNLLDVSPVSLVGMSRIAGRFDGAIDYSVFLDPDVAHVPLSALPTTMVPIMVAIPGSAGAEAAMLLAKLVNYAPAIGSDLAASFSVEAQASEGVGLAWGKMITAGKRTDTGATATGTGIDLGVPAGVSTVAIDTSSVDNPTTITTSTPHGLQTGDSVLIAGHSGSTPSINDGYTVTVTSTTEFTIPVNVSVGGTGGTMQRTSYRGWEAQVQVFSVTGTSVTVKLQDAPKQLSGSFVDLSGGGFAAVTSGAGRGAERIASSAGIIQRFVRVATTGTFNPATFAVAVSPTPG